MFSLSPDAPPALPFWIDGHAVLTLGERLDDVPNPAQGAVLRRVPVCGAADAQRAVATARLAQAAWAALDPARRQAQLAALAAALAGYAPHFARLLGEDAGLTAPLAAEEIAAAERALLAPTAASALPSIQLLLPGNNDTAPFLDAVRRLATALSAGATVVLLTPVCAAAPLLALAELAARSGFPDGVLNVVHGDAESAQALRRAVAGASA